jgi:hypothetical protein
MSSNGKSSQHLVVFPLTSQREAGRTRLIDDHKLKRENETAHRAALYVVHWCEVEMR